LLDAGDLEAGPYRSRSFPLASTICQMIVTRAGFGPVISLARRESAENDQRLALADFQTDRTRGPHRRFLARDYCLPPRITR